MIPYSPTVFLWKASLWNTKFPGLAFQLCDYSPMYHFVNVHLLVMAIYVTVHYTDGLIQGQSSSRDVFTLREVAKWLEPGCFIVPYQWTAFSTMSFYWVHLKTFHYVQSYTLILLRRSPFPLHFYLPNASEASGFLHCSKRSAGFKMKTLLLIRWPVV